MRSINKVVLIGNLTRDPELKKTLNNQSITTFGLATNREWITKDGRKEQSAEFHDLACWGGLAEFAQQNLKKGKLVYVEGYLKTRSWDDASGVKKFRTEIIVEDLIMLDKRPAEAGLKKEADDSSAVSAASADNLQPQISIENPQTL